MSYDIRAERINGVSNSESATLSLRFVIIASLLGARPLNPKSSEMDAKVTGRRGSIPTDRSVSQISVDARTHN
eukprot:511775-Amphidinium_carterae.2